MSTQPPKGTGGNVARAKEFSCLIINVYKVNHVYLCSLFKVAIKALSPFSFCRRNSRKFWTKVDLMVQMLL